MAGIRDPRIEVRLATLDETHAVAEVLREAFASYEPAYTLGGFSATTPTGDQIRKRFEEGPIWVALLAGMIVGTVSAVPKGGGLYIRSMAVRPQAGGLGIGRLLLQQAEAFATEQGYVQLFLSTTPFLLHAIRLYEHFGFQRATEGPADLWGTPLFTMTKTIRRAVS